VAVQRALVVLGAAGVAVGREVDGHALLGVAATAEAAGLAVLGGLLVGIARGAVQARVRPAVTAYLVAVTLGVVGIGVGAALGTGHGGAAYGRWRDAHQAINLLGLVGFVVAGTLPFFVATQAKVRTSRHATAAAQVGAQAGLGLGLGLVLVGLAVDERVPVAAGLSLYGATLVLLVTLLPRLGAKQLRWAGPRLVQVVASLAWRVGAVAVAAAHAAGGRPVFGGVVVPALVLGGDVQLVAASLAYLGPVLVGGGHQRLAASFGLTRSWVALVAANLAAAGACGLGPWWLLRVAAAAWAVDGAVRGAALLLARRRVIRS
jgi:hypothetical protein